MAKKYEARDFTGVLFKNTKKTAEKQPDMTGNLMINHVNYRLAAWKKDAGKGVFLSLVVSEFQEKPETKGDSELGF